MASHVFREHVETNVYRCQRGHHLATPVVYNAPIPCSMVYQVAGIQVVVNQVAGTQVVDQVAVAQVLDQVAGTQVVDQVAGVQVLHQVTGAHVVDQVAGAQVVVDQVA